jgi:phosphoribosylanthranilate isomerase
MDLTVKVKASGVNNLSDARYFSTFVEWMGFDFRRKSAMALRIPVAQEIIGWLVGPQLVAEFANESAADINAVCNALAITCIQVEEEVSLDELAPIIETVILRITMNELIDVDRLQSILSTQSTWANYFLLDFTENKLTWAAIKQREDLTVQDLQQFCKDYPIIVQLDFTPQNVSEIVTTLQPQAINLLGGSEEKVGLRAFDDIDPIVEVLEL